MPKANSPDQEPFTSYKLDEERSKDSGETFTIWLSKKERAWLNEQKRLLKQPKDSTCIKQLAKLGAHLLGQPSTAFLVKTLFKNEANNERLGIHEIE